MTHKQHSGIGLARWATFPFYKQILMVANELHRARNWLHKGDIAESRECWIRALELLNMTKSLIRERPTLLRELCRAGEAIAGLYVSSKPTVHEADSIERALIMLSPESYNLLHPA